MRKVPVLVSDKTILQIQKLNQEKGIPIRVLCKQNNITQATFYRRVKMIQPPAVKMLKGIREQLDRLETALMGAA